MAHGLGRWITGAAVTFVLGGMWFASVHYGHGDDLRARLQQFVAEADARAAAADHSHAAPWGETNEGSAFAHYGKAVDDARALGILGFDWHVPHDRGTERSGDPVMPNRLAELRQRWKPVVAGLQRGAHALDRRRGPIAGHHFLVDIAQAEVSARWREGRQDDAVGLWLDLLTACTDAQWSAGGGAAAESIAFWNDARIAELSSADRERLATALAHLDPRLAEQPDARAVVASNVHLRDLLRAVDPLAWSLRQRARAWQFGFDPATREMAAMWELVERLAVLDTPPTGGATSRAQWQSLLVPRRSTTTVATDHIVSWLGYTEDRHRRELTELRLLRLALAFRSSPSMDELADPFADGPIAVTAGAGAAVFTSAGGQSRRATREGR